MGAMKKGSMLLEFVLTMPVLFMLIMLILQFAQIMVVRQFVVYAAFCSTRSMLCANRGEWDPKNDKQFQCTHQAARRALAWVNIFGTPETADMRGWEEEASEVNPGAFSDIDGTPIYYTTKIYGSKETKDVFVPGWGQIPESNSVDNRLDVDVDSKKGLGVFPGQYAASKVTYKFPLLIPVAGQMISSLTKHSGEAENFHGVPYIELTETCVLPLPYSPDRLPGGDPTKCPGCAFDYASYD